MHPNPCCADLCAILQLGWPNSLNLILTFIPGLLMYYFLGSNLDHVAAAGMGFMFTNIAGYSLIIGTGSGAQPLISQAFGARNFKRCGDLLQRQLAIHAVLLLFISFIWLNTEQILLMLRQPPQISSLAGQFVRWRLIALPALALKENLYNYLNAQCVVQLPMFIAIAASLVNVVGFAVLVPHYGFIGAPLAYSLANILQALCTLSLTRWALPHPSAWPKWDIQIAFSEWREMLKLALPGGALMLCEWWGWETNLFFAGLLCDSTAQTGCVQLDTFPIVANTMVIAFMPNYGFSMASGTLIGNALGANDPAKARRLTQLTLGIATTIGGSVAVTLIMCRKWWGSLFTEDADIIALTSQVIPIVAAYIFLDNLGPGALITILRSMSIVAIPATINFFSFYVVGIPFGLWLTFGREQEQWGIIGLWSGLTLAMVTMVGGLLLFLRCCTDYTKAAEAAVLAAHGTSKSNKVDASQAEEMETLKSEHTLQPPVIGKSASRVCEVEDGQTVGNDCIEMPA